MLKVSQLYIYPIKSLAGIAVNESIVTDRGLQHDRRWMLVDKNNQFLTLREYPKMALLHPTVNSNSLTIISQEHKDTPLSIPFDFEEKSMENVTIWNATVAAKKVSQEADQWFSDMLGGAIQLVYMPDVSMRPVDTTSGYHPAGKFTSFADAYPFLLLGEASMNALNSRLPKPFSILRFRPNIVFSGGQPHQEDEIEHFTINGISFLGLENCARCSIPNVNPETGIFDKEPVRTLAKYRTRGKNIEFGRNVVHSGTGKISVGHSIEIV
jgi:uncharacterized protein